MRFFGRREWAVLGGTLALLGGLGFVQSRGGWMEIMKVAPVRDDSTPAAQSGFEFLKAERSTESERAPRITVDGLSVGGANPGPIGSTRIWFRLPALKPGQSRIPQEDDLRAFVSFPNGERYAAGWELAELSQRIATILIPAGYAPADWIDVHLEGKLGKVRWRLKGIPKNPRALPTSGSATFTADGSTVTASAVTLARKILNDDAASNNSGTVRIDFTLDPPSPTKGKGVRFLWDRFTPEYLHPGDDWDTVSPGGLPLGMRTGSTAVRFAYGDLLRQVGVKGHFEVWDSIREPITFENVRWEWDHYLSTQKALYLRGNDIKLTDGSHVSINTTALAPTGPANQKAILRASWTRATGTAVPGAGQDSAVFDLTTDPKLKGWEDEVLALLKSKDYSKSIRLGQVKGFLEHRRVVRTIPFDLLVPVAPGDPKKIAEEKAQMDREAAGRLKTLQERRSRSSSLTPKAN